MGGLNDHIALICVDQLPDNVTSRTVSVISVRNIRSKGSLVEPVDIVSPIVILLLCLCILC